MKIDEVMLELKNYGNENTKKTLAKHGAKEPFFGVYIYSITANGKTHSKKMQLLK